MAEDLSRPIIVKKIKKSGGGHHGGAWKIAYADFVTAMMAFFLLMWLLGSSSHAQLEGISKYFKMPLKIALNGGSSVGEATSLVKGGGKDLTKKQGQIQGVDDSKKRDKEITDLKDAQKALEQAEAERLQDLKQKILATIESNPTLKQFKNQLLIDITTEGLRIQIVDEQNRPMFASSKADLQPYAKEILHQIGQLLNGVPNRISLSGHTDAVPYPSGDKGYSNWELSSDRANASRRELVAGGLEDDKMLRVVGLSSAVMFDKENPLNPINRRISIIVMNKRTEDAVLNDSLKVDANDKSSMDKITENIESPK